MQKKPTTSPNKLRTNTHYNQSSMTRPVFNEAKIPLIKNYNNISNYSRKVIPIDRNLAYIEKLKLMLTNNPKYNQIQQSQTISHSHTHTEATPIENTHSPSKQPSARKGAPHLHQRTQSHFTTLSYLNTSYKQINQNQNESKSIDRSLQRSRIKNCEKIMENFIEDTNEKKKINNNKMLNEIKTDLVIGKKRVVSVTGAELAKVGVERSRIFKGDLGGGNLTKNRVKYEVINYSKFTPYPKSFDQEKDKKISQQWGKIELLQILGTGANANVRQAVHNNTKYAVKIYEKYKLLEPRKKKRVYSQIQLLHSLAPHQNIISMVQAFEDKREIHVIMQYMQNSITLHQHFRNNMLNLDIGEIRKIFARVVRAVVHLSENGIAHRDIKPDNILICWPEDDRDHIEVKIIDFGFGVKSSVSDFHCGTPNFMAPQLLEKGSKYTTFPVDVWALGIMLFYLCEGRYPFRGYDQRDLYKCIKKGVYQFTKIKDQSIKEIIQLMLQIDPEKRITAKQLVKKDWVWSL